jgi:hypothetical protein
MGKSTADELLFPDILATETHFLKSVGSKIVVVSAIIRGRLHVVEEIN